MAVRPFLMACSRRKEVHIRSSFTWAALLRPNFYQRLFGPLWNVLVVTAVFPQVYVAAQMLPSRR